MNEDILFSSPGQIAQEQQKFLSKVYGWMAAALAITGLTAWLTASSDSMIQFIFGNRGVFFFLIIGQLLLVGVIAGWLNKISSQVATLIFIAYSVFTGITFSALFLLYTAGSLASTFLITGGMFAVMSIYGWTTGKDLTNFGSLLFMALIGLVIASIVNLFLGSEMLYWITTYVGVFVFTGLIAFKTQRIKNLAGELQEGTDDYDKSAVMGAFSLYLSFVNLFLMLLRIFGRRR